MPNSLEDLSGVYFFICMGKFTAVEFLYIGCFNLAF